MTTLAARFVRGGNHAGDPLRVLREVERVAADSR